MDQQVSSTKQFMVLRDGRQIGPLKAAELQNQAREGAISPLDSVCAVGSDTWVLGYQVKGLFPAWLAAEIRERLAKGEGVDDLLQASPSSRQESIEDERVAQEAQGMLFAVCDACGAKDVYAICNGCDRFDCFANEGKHARCECGRHLPTYISCPHCDASIWKSCFRFDSAREKRYRRGLPRSGKVPLQGSSRECSQSPSVGAVIFLMLLVGMVLVFAINPDWFYLMGCFAPVAIPFFIVTVIVVACIKFIVRK